MDLQTIYAEFSRYLVAATVTGGGVAAISLGLFKLYGTKWLDARFAERLQNLKAEQDRSIRQVQSTIDREIHRAKKLYDSEFTALSECWTRLCKAFFASSVTSTSLTAPVDKMTSEEFERHLTKRGMDEWDQRSLVPLSGSERFDAYYRWSEWKRLQKLEELHADFATFIDSNSIFFADGFTEKFRKLEELIFAVNVEFRVRIESRGLAIQPFDFLTALSRLNSEGKSLLAEMEGMVRSRLWAVARDGQAV